ncbi:uroporphyrinogen decarboxylase family protein [Chloroflexota bacterium]
MLTPVRNSFWAETLREWVKQGAPEQILDSRFRGDYFQFQHIHWLAEIRSGWFGAEMRDKTDIGYGIVVSKGLPPIVPAYEPRIITEDERTVTYINGTGQTARSLKKGRVMPTFLDWPVKDRASWNEYKKRLEPTTSERWPSDWNTYVQKMNSKPEPISLEIGGFFGYLREWIGAERILYMFYDDPSLIEDMMEQMLYLETEIIKRTLKDIKVEEVTFWEDMCYKAGPLISPDMVRKFMMPRYKKLTNLVRSYGVDVIFLDSDGNVDELIPIWLESGINFLWPLEVAAGNDAVAIRKKFGKNLIISGAIDKRALIKGKDAIREEVMSKVPFLLEQGGYFPSVDHEVPPDVTWENYIYFLNTLREIAGLQKLPQ